MPEPQADESPISHPPPDSAHQSEAPPESSADVPQTGLEAASDAGAQRDTLYSEAVNEGEESGGEDNAEHTLPASASRADDLTMADLVGAFWRAPRATTRTFRDVMRSDGDVEVDLPVGSSSTIWQHLKNVFTNYPRMQVTFYLFAFVAAIRGCLLLSSVPLARRSEAVDLASGAPWLVSAFFIWVVGEIYGHWPELVDWWRGRSTANRVSLAIRAVPAGLMVLGVTRLVDAMDAPVQRVAEIALPGVQLLFAGVALWMLLDAGAAVRRFVGITPVMADGEEKLKSNEERGNWFMALPVSRFVFALVGAMLSGVVWVGAAGNNMSTPIFYMWLASIGLWAWAFAPLGWQPHVWMRDQFERVRNYRVGGDWWVAIALLLIMALAITFRFTDLATHPLEMTDDHVEKILDAGLVREGLRPIFFANNGGREPFQMYAIALFSYLPGLGIDHYTIKFVAVIESLITIPILFWMGYELTPSEKRRTRLLVGLVLAGLVAASYWHVAITRLGLRIVLTPLVAALLTIFLARGIRYNRRADYIICGLILGFGLYTYQAVRMLPVVVVVAVMVAIYFNAKSWLQRIAYVGNLTVLVLIAVTVFLPMGRYAIDNPDLFWRRATGRLMGDDVVEIMQQDGTMLTRSATLEERVQAFSDNVPALLSNLRNVLLMFNWKGDGATINGVPNEPAMDDVAGALLIIGLAAWLTLAIKRRDPVYWLVPVFLFIMLLPSALSIAMPNENPSHTRASGALPYVYLIAAYPLVMIADRYMVWLTGRMGKVIAVGVCTVVILGSYTDNTRLYFGVYPDVYTESFHPYTEVGGFLRGFAESTGSYGNAYMIGYPFWWSHRAIGLAAGLEERWPNGIVERENIPRWLRDGALRDDRYRFDPERDIAFFYAPQDTESAALLAALFPQGRAIFYETAKTGDDYFVYYVPALGEAAFRDFLREHLSPGQ